MFTLTEVMIRNCVERLQAGYRHTYGSLNPDYADLIGWIANMALEQIANSDALYHDVEHTILVTLVGQEILRGKHLRNGSVACEDWLNAIASWLCHDIGYVKGVCRDDQTDKRLYSIGVDEMMISLPIEATDASLTPYHVDRSKVFVEECLGSHSLINVPMVQQNIELTRFPVPLDNEHKDIINYPGLTRAADLIGQLSDPYYLQKLPALFYEFEESGTNKILGFRNPGDLRKNYPNFFWHVVFQYIQPALSYLELTMFGNQIIANLYANVFQVEQENGIMNRELKLAC
ncbi:MAG TPA: metal-dependent phosphohydrolase [Cyanobacteria bacterium UBA11162]|nr:metal-dependent phosphohydrolase [Cyanobacteria bacterium UBA11162]